MRMYTDTKHYHVIIMYSIIRKRQFRGQSIQFPEVSVLSESKKIEDRLFERPRPVYANAVIHTKNRAVQK